MHFFFLLQLSYLCSYSSKTCRMHLWSARSKSVAEGQTPWFLLHSIELEELIAGWEGPRGGDSRRSTAVLWQLNGMDGSPFLLLPLGLIPTKELQYLTFNCFYTGVVLSHLKWLNPESRGLFWGLLEGITSLSYGFLMCQLKWTEVIYSSQNHVPPNTWPWQPWIKRLV